MWSAYYLYRIHNGVLFIAITVDVSVFSVQNDTLPSRERPPLLSIPHMYRICRQRITAMYVFFTLTPDNIVCEKF